MNRPLPFQKLSCLWSFLLFIRRSLSSFTLSSHIFTSSTLLPLPLRPPRHKSSYSNSRFGPINLIPNMLQFMNSKRSKSCASDSRCKYSFRLFSSFFSSRKNSQAPKQRSESAASSVDKMDASPVTPAKRSGTHDLHILTPATHKTLTIALEQLSESASSGSEKSSNTSQRRLFFSSGENYRRKEGTFKDNSGVLSSHPKYFKQSYSQLRARSDLLTVENVQLRKRLSQLEMAEVERNSLQSKVSELEWALDVLRDDADRIRDDALALIEDDFAHSFHRRFEREEHTEKVDFCVGNDVEDIDSDDAQYCSVDR